MAIMRTIKLPAALSVRLDDYVLSSALSRSEIIRAAIEHYLDLRAGRGCDPRRLALVSEYNQIVLDFLLSQAAPERKQQFLADARARMERHHG